MKIKVIIVNLLLIVVIFFFIDFFCFYKMNKEVGITDFHYIAETYKHSFKMRTFADEYARMQKNGEIRDTVDPHNKKPPVIILGCSFSYGWLLDEKQSFGYKLSELTGRNVYNRSVSGAGIQYFPYILKYTGLKKEVKNPEYIIYVYINNHVYRLMRYYLGEFIPIPDIRYKYNKKTNNFKLLKTDCFYGRFAFVRFLTNRYALKKYQNELHYCDYSGNSKYFDLLKNYFLYAKRIANKKFPNAKIVILIYEEPKETNFFSAEQWKELEDEGFIVLNTYELTGKHLYDSEYKIENDEHPNEKAWDIITPALVKKLNL